MEGDLEKRLRAGETDLFADVFTIHRPRVWQIVNFRLDTKVRGRVDPDDVVQRFIWPLKSDSSTSLAAVLIRFFCGFVW